VLTGSAHTAPKFIDKTLHPDFEPADALRMLQVKHTIDFGSKRSGGRAAKPTDNFYPQFFLDFLSIVGKPGRPISRRDGALFDNVTVTFQRWGAPYGAKHVSGISFDLTGRTFRIAKAATREVWFIVMHPVSAEMELPRSAADGRRREGRAGGASGMPVSLARQLSSYITSVFEAGELLGEGVESCWRPGSPHSQCMTSAKWAVFQGMFMDGWAAWAATHGAASFWRQHTPAFHAYDYGANIGIEVSPRLYDLPRERHDPASDDSDRDEDEGDGESGGEDDGGISRGVGGLFVGEGGGGGSPDPQSRAPGEGHGTDHDEMIRENDGLRKLTEELQARFDLGSIGAVSYALAVCINSDTDGGAAGAGSTTRCLLVDRNKMAREFPHSRDWDFYPQAFHPVYGNVSSSTPPGFLASLTAAMRGNMSARNEGAEVLSFGYFQGYTNIKRSVRHSPNDLLATKGYATGALTVPTAEASGHHLTRDKRERLLRIVRGQVTPEDPAASKPFARERRQIEVALEQEEVAYRLEQVVSLDVGRMTAEERTFGAVLQPIFQLMRFFLVEHDSYVHIFRSLPLTVFPRVMMAYARVFELALDEMERRYVQGGERGLDLPHSEAVAVVDRLGGYCFSGFWRHLPKTVLRPLGTVASLRSGAWPYVDPTMLDFGAGVGSGASIDVRRWPRSAANERLVLLHTAQLRFHYNERIASSRESNVWFAILGEAAFRSQSAVADFVVELLRELWVPQTKSFVAQQLRRRLHEADRTEAAMPMTSAQMAACEAAIEAWDEAVDAFTWKAFERLSAGLAAGGDRMAVATSKSRARHDFAREMLVAAGGDRGRDAVASKSATWPAKLQSALQHARRSGIDPLEWAGVVTSSLLAAGVEWAPDSIRGRITSRRAVRLQGTVGAEAMTTAPLGSRLRAVQEAEIKHEEAKRERALRARPARIDLGCDFPFTNIPGVVRAGFDDLKRIFSKGGGDVRVLDHYQLAMDCLAAHIDDPPCHLMLLLALTVSASSVTPKVDPASNEFVTGPTKDQGHLAVALVTRMMWHLYPESFPWSGKKGGGALSVPEMTKKIGKSICPLLSRGRGF
jgi:hypothetical protein